MCPLIIDFNKIELCYNTNAHDIYIYTFWNTVELFVQNGPHVHIHEWFSMLDVGYWICRYLVIQREREKSWGIMISIYNMYSVLRVSVNLKPFLTIIHNWFDIYFFKAIFIYDLEIKITFGYPMHRIFTSLGFSVHSTSHKRERSGPKSHG